MNSVRTAPHVDVPQTEEQLRLVVTLKATHGTYSPPGVSGGGDGDGGDGGGGAGGGGDGDDADDGYNSTRHTELDELAFQQTR